MNLTNQVNSKKRIGSPDDVAAILYALLRAERETLDYEKEHFWVVGLKSNNQIRYVELVSLGFLNASIAQPREFFRTAIMRNVASIIIGHNHPSGQINPSSEDRIITSKLYNAGKLLDIEVLDHIIIGDPEQQEENEHYSFKQNLELQ